MKTRTLREAIEAAALLAALVTGCAPAMTQAQLEQDTRDSLTTQGEYPKMFARAGTTVGDMRRDWRLCAAESPNMQKYRAIHTPGADGWFSEGLRDAVTGGMYSSALLRDGVTDTTACMKTKGYSRRD